MVFVGKWENCFYLKNERLHFFAGETMGIQFRNSNKFMEIFATRFPIGEGNWEKMEK